MKIISSADSAAVSFLYTRSILRGRRLDEASIMLFMPSSIEARTRIAEDLIWHRVMTPDMPDMDRINEIRQMCQPGWNLFLGL